MDINLCNIMKLIAYILISTADNEKPNEAIQLVCTYTMLRKPWRSDTDHGTGYSIKSSVWKALYVVKAALSEIEETVRPFVPKGIWRELDP